MIAAVAPENACVFIDESFMVLGRSVFVDVTRCPSAPQSRMLAVLEAAEVAMLKMGMTSSGGFGGG